MSSFAGVGAESAERTFERLYSERRLMVVRFLTNQVRRADWHLAEDLAQVTFQRAWRNLPAMHKIDVPEAVQAWLCTIARRVVADHYRKGPGRQWAVEAPADPTTSAVWRTELSSDPDLADEVCERVDLARALPRLTAEHRQALQLRVIEELPWAAAAASMHRGKAAVRRMVGEVVAGLDQVVEVES